MHYYLSIGLKIRFTDFVYVKDWLGLNRYKFYGDELNKKAKPSNTTKFQEQEKISFWDEIFQNR